jgi:hypothetical protein
VCRNDPIIKQGPDPVDQGVADDLVAVYEQQPVARRLLT